METELSMSTIIAEISNVKGIQQNQQFTFYLTNLDIEKQRRTNISFMQHQSNLDINLFYLINSKAFLKSFLEHEE